MATHKKDKAKAKPAAKPEASATTEVAEAVDAVAVPSPEAQALGATEAAAVAEAAADPERATAGAAEGNVDAALQAQASQEAAVAAGDAPAPEPAETVQGERLESIIESLLFASDRPLTVNDLKRLLGDRDAKKITVAVEALQARRQELGVQVVSVAGGWQLRTPPANGHWVSKLMAGRPVRLSRAQLETVAIIAYKQPITRPEIDDIRQVDCGPVLGTLLDRGLIRVIGKKEEVGRPLLYGTTPEFLGLFSLKDLTQLPTLREFHELAAEDRARVDSTHPAAGEPAGPAGGGMRAGITPHAGFDAEDDENDELLGELEAATKAAGRASKEAAPPAAEAAEPEPGSPN